MYAANLFEKRISFLQPKVCSLEVSMAVVNYNIVQELRVVWLCFDFVITLMNDAKLQSSPCTVSDSSDPYFTPLKSGWVVFIWGGLKPP